MKIFSIVLLVVIISGCVATLQKPIESPLRGSVYNSIGNKYYERLTTIEYEEAYGQTRLYVYVESYGRGKERVWFGKEYVNQYLKLIDKYLKWHNMAVRDKDILDKEIGIADSAGGVNVKFSIFSGNSKSHYLVLSSGLLGTYTKKLMFSYNNAKHLRNLLVKFGGGNLKFTNDSKYK
ncbi:MAG: hypothetical protein QM500_00750 [Methylococcales bacterium]